MTVLLSAGGAYAWFPNPTKADNLVMSNELLQHSEILRVDPRHSHVVRVLCGTAYVTVEGDREDHFLGSGEELEVGAHHLALIQGWPEAQVQIL